MKAILNFFFVLLLLSAFGFGFISFIELSPNVSDWTKSTRFLLAAWVAFSLTVAIRDSLPGGKL